MKDNYWKVCEDVVYVFKFIKEIEYFCINFWVNFDGINIYFWGSWVEMLIDWFVCFWFGIVVV